MSIKSDVSANRSPRGERGLKLRAIGAGRGQGESLPARGARIETSSATASGSTCWHRSPRVERGLKLLGSEYDVDQGGANRSPRGERGLKHVRRERRAIARIAPRAGSAD